MKIKDVILWGFIALLTFSLVGLVSATTRTVCSSGCDYNAIGLAIDASTNGDTIYVYNGSYKEHIVISKSITLEGESRDSTVIDGSAYGVCIQITANNTTVKGLGIKNCQYGIKANGGSNKLINNSILIDNVNLGTYERGIGGYGGGINNYGIYTPSSNNEITGNIIQISNNTQSICGICLAWYYNNVISNNLIKIPVGSPENYGIFVNEYNSTIINNTISSEGGGDSNTDSGIVLYGAWDLGNNRIYNNTIYTIANIPSSYSKTSLSCRIRVMSKNNKIINNNISNNYGGGICIQNSNNTIQNNYISNNEDGIYMAGGFLSIFISNNTLFSNRRYGAFLQYSINNTISENNFRYNNDYDIYLPFSTYNHITNNTVCKIYYTETNIIINNTCPYQTPPTITLNSPENNSQVSNINATFNFTAIDNIDPSLSCSLYLDSALNRTNSSVYNGSATFFVVSNLGFGNHSWNVNCTDTDGNSNVSERRTITVTTTTTTTSTTTTTTTTTSTSTTTSIAPTTTITTTTTSSTTTSTTTTTLLPSPSGFWGNANLDGNPAIVGSVVSAWIGSVQCGSYTIETAGTYGLVVVPNTTTSGCGTEGAIVIFKINGNVATSTGTWHSDTNQYIDIYASTSPTTTTTSTTTTSSTITTTIPLSLSVTRILPSIAQPNSNLTISLNLVILNESNKPNSIIIKDYAPKGWNLTSSNPNRDDFNSGTGEIRWLLYGGELYTRNLTYTMTISNVTGTIEFSGVLLYTLEENLITLNISGNKTIQIGYKADKNDDGKIDDFELLDYINLWVQGHVDDFSLLIAIDKWAKG